MPLFVLCVLVLGVSTLGVARAHVGVLPSEAAPASNLEFTVRVPNEKDEPTVQVRVEFPANLTVSRFQPKVGWEREIERDAAGRITAVTWSGGQIGPDEYEDFAFVARTPSEPGVLTFKAYQTYQGGETVEWVNPEGQDNPAAFVEVQAAPTTGQETDSPAIEEAEQTTGTPEAGLAATVTPVESVASPAPLDQVAPTAQPAGVGGDATVDTLGSGSDLPLFTALGALVIALLALALAAVALVRRREVT